MKKRLTYIVCALLLVLTVGKLLGMVQVHSSAPQSGVNQLENRRAGSQTVLLQAPSPAHQLTDMVGIDLDDDDFQENQSTFIFLLAAAVVYLCVSLPMYHGRAKHAAADYHTPHVQPIPLHVLFRNFRI